MLCWLLLSHVLSISLSSPLLYSPLLLSTLPSSWFYSRWANLCNFVVVSWMSFPIAAALLPNSPLAPPLPLPLPLDGCLLLIGWSGVKDWSFCLNSWVLDLKGAEVWEASNRCDMVCRLWLWLAGRRGSSESQPQQQRRQFHSSRLWCTSNIGMNSILNPFSYTRTVLQGLVSVSSREEGERQSWSPSFQMRQAGQGWRKEGIEFNEV